MIGYTDLVNNIQCIANYIRPSLTDTILKVMAYIIAYIPIRAEPYQVLCSVSIAKSIGKTLITMTPSIQVSNRLVEQLEPYQPLSQLSQGPRPQTDQAGPPSPCYPSVHLPGLSHLEQHSTIIVSRACASKFKQAM
jgi:hypothetical protein